MNFAGDKNSRTARRRCAVGVGAIVLLTAWIRINVVSAMNRAGLEGPELAAALKPALTNCDGMIRRAARATLERLETTNADVLRPNAR